MSCVAFLGSIGAADATVIAQDSGSSHPYQRWVDRAQVPTPDAVLRVTEQPCDVHGDFSAGCTAAGWDAIYASGASRAAVRRVFYHELGHQFDYRHLIDAERAAFMVTVGLRGAWRQPELGPESPHEHFAGVYEVCARGGPGPDELTAFGRRRIRDACGLIRRAGR